MSGITIGPTPERYPAVVYPLLVDVKATWSDVWRFVSDLVCESVQLVDCNQGMDTAVITRKYAPLLKQPWESSYSQARPVNLQGYWVRVRLPSNRGESILFVGRISGNSIMPSGAEAGPTGIQQWTAYGPLQLLRKIHVSHSFHADDLGNNASEVGWVPPMNDATDRGWIVGNRSAEKVGETYVFGIGSDSREVGEKWTHGQFVEYLLKRFAEHDDGPTWTIGGQAELLEQLETVGQARQTGTIADYLTELIPPRFGMSFNIRPTEDGFEINVYALTDVAVSWGDVTLPKNPNTTRIIVGQTKDNIATHLEQSDDHRYATIRVEGRRIVTCATFSTLPANPNLPYLPGGLQAAIAESLEYGWTLDLQQEYDVPPRPDIAIEDDEDYAINSESQDRARAADKYASVYRYFRVPMDYTFRDGALVFGCKEDGELSDVAGEYQIPEHRFLSWTPLLAGYNYAEDPAENLNPPSVSPECLPPRAWCGNFTADDMNNDSGTFGWEQWLDVGEDLNMHLNVAKRGMGVQFSGNFGHAMGMGEFVGPFSELAPVARTDKLVVTAAWEGDHRLSLEYQVPDADPDDGTLVVHDDEAEMWVLAPHTVVNAKVGGGNVPCELVTSGATARVLRSDVDRLAFVMAGVLARYKQGRLRATITKKGYGNWGGLLGRILVAVEEGGIRHQVGCPITSITWASGQSPTTILRAGFAQ